VEASFVIRSRMGNDTWPRSANSHRSKGHVNMPPTFPVVFVCVNMPPTFPAVRLPIRRPRRCE
jgi:hypothetical protein